MPRREASIMRILLPGASSPSLVPSLAPLPVHPELVLSMVTYEITATVRSDLCDDYERYMRDTHIPDLMRTGSFVAATFGRSAPGRYRIRYEAKSRADLDAYIAAHAPRLRAHFGATFPAGIELSREEWEIVESWEASA